MPINFKNYIVNKDVHELVGHMIKGEVKNVNANGLKWTVMTKEGKNEIQFNQFAKVGIVERIANFVVFIFNCINPLDSYFKKYRVAIKQLNQPSEGVDLRVSQVTDKLVNKVAEKEAEYLLIKRKLQTVRNQLEVEGKLIEPLREDGLKKQISILENGLKTLEGEIVQLGGEIPKEEDVKPMPSIVPATIPNSVDEDKPNEEESPRAIPPEPEVPKPLASDEHTKEVELIILINQKKKDLASLKDKEQILTGFSQEKDDLEYQIAVSASEIRKLETQLKKFEGDVVDKPLFEDVEPSKKSEKPSSSGKKPLDFNVEDL